MGLGGWDLGEDLVLCNSVILSFRNYMNDSLRTDVFVRFQPESIACACIYLAARTLEVSSMVPLTSSLLGITVEAQTEYFFPSLSDSTS